MGPMDQGPYVVIVAWHSNATNDFHHGPRTYTTRISLQDDEELRLVFALHDGNIGILSEFAASMEITL